MSNDLLSEGTYRAKAFEWTLTETKAGDGQAFVNFRFVDEEMGGYEMGWFGSFKSDKSTEITLKALRACGWKGVDVLELERADCGLDANVVALVVEHEEYEGKVRARVRWVNEIGGASRTTPLSPDKKQSFAARIKANILAFEMQNPKAPGAKPGASRQQDPPPHTDTDAPPF